MGVVASIPSNTKDKLIQWVRSVKSKSASSFNSRPSIPSPRITGPAVERAVNEIAGKFNVPVRVVATAAELPSEIRDAALRRQEGGDVVLGIYHGGKVWIVAEHMRSADEARKVFIHEAVGHYGLRKVMGREFEAFLDFLVNDTKYGAEIRAFADEYGIVDMREAADEWFSRKAETGKPGLSLWSRFMFHVRKWLRSLGVKIEYGKPELVELLRVSREAARKGGAVETGGKFLNVIMPDGKTVRKGRDTKGFEIDGRPAYLFKIKAADEGDITREKKETRFSTRKAEKTEGGAPATCVNHLRHSAEVNREVRHFKRTSSLGEWLTPISTILERIDPSLKYDRVMGLRMVEAKISIAIKEDMEAVLPLIEKAKKAIKDGADLTAWDIARKNGDEKEIRRLVAKYRLMTEYSSARRALDGIYERAKAAGNTLGYKGSFWPRMIQDSEGFLNLLHDKTRNCGFFSGEWNTIFSVPGHITLTLHAPKGVPSANAETDHALSLLPVRVIITRPFHPACRPGKE